MKADPGTIELREVRPDDLPIFFTQQLDPEACAMAAVPARARDAFDAHWALVLADLGVVNRTVLADGSVAGHLACFTLHGRREVAYQLGREFWGRGIASAALALLLGELNERPLYATVAEHNAGSLRVLEKCGFVRTGSQVAEDGVTEIRLALGA